MGRVDPFFAATFAISRSSHIDESEDKTTGGALEEGVGVVVF